MKNINLFLILVIFQSCSINNDSYHLNENNENRIEEKKRLTEILNKSNDIMQMSLNEYKVYIDDYVKKSKYPNKSWTDTFEPIQNMDVIIASDVIEHIGNPDELLDLIDVSKPKLIVLSTPNRDLLQKGQDGPPKNTAHFREWSFDEFNRYVGNRFNIIEHVITNEKQGTQTIVCEVK